jgi:hypothetical protein
LRKTHGPPRERVIEAREYEAEGLDPLDYESQANLNTSALVGLNPLTRVVVVQFNPATLTGTLEVQSVGAEI